jgi:high-affinity Fe2+/Pb2+ permease
VPFLVQKFEQRYDTVLKRNKKNDFYDLLIDLSSYSIKALLTDYYFKIIQKQMKTANSFNDINTELYTQLKEVIKTYTEQNLKEVVRIYYGIRENTYDRQIENQTPINDFLIGLIDYIATNGIIQLDSLIYNNTKQYINIYMNELLSKTLDYIRIIIDVFHRWAINYYYSLKTFDIITKQTTN